MRTVELSSTVGAPGTREVVPAASGGTLSARSLSVTETTTERATDPTQQEIRLALRVVLHLSHAGPLEAGSVVSPRSTQQGMASDLGVTQGAVSKVLRRLAAAGVVRHARHHVQGRGRRMRAYCLTARGLDIVRRWQERVSDPRRPG